MDVVQSPIRPKHPGKRLFSDMEERRLLARVRSGEREELLAVEMNVHFNTILNAVKRALAREAAEIKKGEGSTPRPNN